MMLSKIKATGLVILVLIIILATSHFQLSGLFHQIIFQYLNEVQLSILAALIYISLYVGATVLLLPSFAMIIFAGAYFGPLAGSIYTLIGSLLGAMITFLVVRLLGRELVVHIMAKKLPAIYRYDQALKRQGFITVLSLRLIPLFPFGSLNYALGLSGVRTKDYLLATTIGIIPGIILYSYLGSSVADFKFLHSIIAAVLLIMLVILAKHYRQYNVHEK